MEALHCAAHQWGIGLERALEPVSGPAGHSSVPISGIWIRSDMKGDGVRNFV